MEFCQCVLSSESSYPELEVLHPLSYYLILWGGGVGHLELVQVIASWSIAVFVKHNRGAGTACTERKRERERGKDRKVLAVVTQRETHTL